MNSRAVNFHEPSEGVVYDDEQTDHLRELIRYIKSEACQFVLLGHATTDDDMHCILNIYSTISTYINTFV